MQGFIIHLERATDRRPHVDRLIQALPFPTEIWSACDGKALTPGQLAAMKAKKALFQPKYPFPIAMGEIACFESHRAIWRHMVAEDLPCAMVFEDDVTVDPPVFARAIALAEKHVAGHGYTQFQTRPIPSGVTEVARDGDVKLVRPDVVPLRTSAQLVSQDAARALLAASDRIDRPIDVFVQMFWETGVRPHCVVPSGASELPAPTTIQSKRSLGHKLAAEVKRPLYRNRIKRLSRKHC